MHKACPILDQGILRKGPEKKENCIASYLLLIYHLRTHMYLVDLLSHLSLLLDVFLIIFL